jgi:peroxiredoxin
MFKLFPPYKWIAITVLLFTFGWIVVSTVLLLPEAPTTISAPQIGFLAPDFDLPSLQNERHQIRNGETRIVLVNFFASWCPPCKTEMPSLQKVYTEYHPRGLEIYSITNMQQDNIADVQQLIQSSAATFPILLDQDGSTYNAYAIRALPTTFLIDSHGRIQKTFYGGPLSESLLVAEIERLLRAD